MKSFKSGTAILTVEEVAERLKISTTTVIRFIDNNKLKAAKIGRQWRIRETELENFIEKSST